MQWEVCDERAFAPGGLSVHHQRLRAGLDRNHETVYHVRGAQISDLADLGQR